MSFFQELVTGVRCRMFPRHKFHEIYARLGHARWEFTTPERLEDFLQVTSGPEDTDMSKALIL
jgi:hypothetical protein